MRPSIALLGFVACGGFPSPWNDADPIDITAEGWMRTAIDHPHPGAGWFRAGELEAFDFSQATVTSVRRAKDDVVVLQIGRLAAEGPTVLELDIALGSWVAGSLPVDGVASVGEIRQPGESRRFVVGGSVDVRSAGVAPGEIVEIAFTDLQLAQARP